MFEEILTHPLFNFGNIHVTLLVILELAFWLVTVFALKRFLRSLVLGRVLRHTPLLPGSQFAVIRIFGYAFIEVEIYLGLVFVNFYTRPLTISIGAVGSGLQNIVSNFISGIIPQKSDFRSVFRAYCVPPHLDSYFFCFPARRMSAACSSNKSPQRQML